MVYCTRTPAPAPSSEPNTRPGCRALLTSVGRAVCRSRPGAGRASLLLQLTAYSLYYVSFGSGRLWYLFLRTRGWDQERFIALKVVRKGAGILLLLAIPAIQRLGSDLSLLLLSNGVQGAGLLLAACPAPALLYLGLALIPAHYPKYSLARALLSSTVHPAEVRRHSGEQTKVLLKAINWIFVPA